MIHSVIDTAGQAKETTPPALWLLGIGTFAVGTDAFVIAGVLPEMAADLDVTPGVAGQLITIFSLTYALFAPISATLTQRLSRRTTLIWALVVFVVGNLVAAGGDTYALAVVGRVIAGRFSTVRENATVATNATLTNGPGR